MGNVIKSTFMLVFIVEFIIGNSGNGLIALVNCVDWVRRRKVSSVDHILTALAVSRIGQLWSVLICTLAWVFYPGSFMSGEMYRIMYVPWTVTNHFSIWLATCLSIFYFLKIANFSNFIFLYLKWRVKKVVSVTLILSLVLLFLNTVSLHTDIEVMIDGYKRNMSYSSSAAQLTRLFMFTYAIPFTASLATFLLLICSLWKHLKKMKHKAAGSRDASTMAHMKALQTVIAFLLLYTMFFLSAVVQFWSFDFLEKSMTILCFQTIGIAFPSGHSWVLILGNSKLRRTLFSMLGWPKCRSKDEESSGL